MPLTCIDHYPVFPALLPPREIVQHRYSAAFATRPDHLDAVLRLRFEVFNLEMGEGLGPSFETCRDTDEFDPVFHHLMVVDHPHSAVVGTYRMQTSTMAARHRGFYSDGEFDLSAIPASVRENAVEVGRTCIARAHRNSVVFLLLWKGLAGYLSRSGTRYLFGCCSLPTTNPAHGLAAMRYFERSGHVHPSLWAMPRPGWICDAPGESRDAAEFALPPLFRLYLRYGARVCSPPAMDRHFKTIDFLLLLDLNGLRDQTRRRFFDDQSLAGQPTCGTCDSLSG
jgi:putative hemolysin